MKDIKKILEKYYKQITEIFNAEDDSPKLLHKKNFIKKKEDEELLTGAVIVFLIVIILFSTVYYFVFFAPQQEEINNLKAQKTNQVNALLKDDQDQNRLAIISQIERCDTLQEVENVDVEALCYPILKNILLNQLEEYKDRYNRVEVLSDNSTDIMNIKNATNYIGSCDVQTLSMTSIRPVDSVIVPLSIDRKQAASGLISQGDVVDIYMTSTMAIESQEDDTLQNQTDTSSSSKIVGGSQVVSILRSKDSGIIEENIDISQSTDNRNISQSNTLDIEQILSAKAAGTYNQSQLNVLLDDYATRLSSYERTSAIGDLDVEYIVMLEVPRSSVEDLINNMDNIILTIPTYDAPSWVKLK